MVNEAKENNCKDHDMIFTGPRKGWLYGKKISKE